MPIRFFSLPAHRLTATDQVPQDELIAPAFPALPEAVESALDGAEFRGARAPELLRKLLQTNASQALPPPLSQLAPSAVFARPPGDLPALLRLADQLETLAKQGEGERALVWICQNCSTRYAVPVSLVRPVSIRCERCGEPVGLFAGENRGEEQLLDPQKGALHQTRLELAGFFREAMARGWPVVACVSPQP